MLANGPALLRFALGEGRKDQATVQTFTFKTAKLGARARVEADRRWVRADSGRGQVHIDYNLVDTIHYWVTRSRGAALTGRLVITDRQGRKLALQCASFGRDGDFVAFARGVSAILAGIGEARPDLRVAPEPTRLHRQVMAGLIFVGVVLAGAASYVFGAEDHWTKAAGALVGLLIAMCVIAFSYGPLRRKPQVLAPGDLARLIAQEVQGTLAARVP